MNKALALAMARGGMALALGFGLASCRPGEAPAPKTIVFFGDSLTVGQGVSPEEAYPALIKKRIGEEGWPHRVVNASVNGDTSQDGLNRIDDALKEKVDVFVLALGANDMIRRLPPEETEKNLNQILSRVKGAYPNVRLVVAGADFGWVLGMFVSRQFKLEGAAVVAGRSLRGGRISEGS